MLLTDTKFIILLFIGNLWIHPQLGIGRGKATSWTTEAGPQALWVLPPTFCDATPHLRSCSSRGWIGHRWEDVECHFPGKTGGEISGVDPVLPVCPVLPLHPTPEEYARQAGARQAKSHDPFHRYPSCGDVGGTLGKPTLDQRWGVTYHRQDAQAEGHCLRGREFNVTIKMWQPAGEQQLSRVGEQIQVLRMSRSAKEQSGLGWRPKARGASSSG